MIDRKDESMSLTGTLSWEQSGQSTVEFALAIMMLMGFVLFFVQLTLVFGLGNYIHYATFMAARAQLAAGPNSDDQRERARAVIVRSLKKSEGQSGVDRFPFIAKAEGGGDPNGAQIGPAPEFNDGDTALSWLQGVRYRFRSRLFILPLGGKRGSDTVKSVKLTSESWLGREPTTDECVAEMSSRGGGIFDNGC